MKKIKYMLFGLLLFIFIGHVYAAPSFSIMPDKFKIQDGQNVTLTIKLNNVMAWDVTVTSSGNTSGCSNHWVEDSGDGSNTSVTLRTTCKANSTGKIVLVVNGKITDNELNSQNIQDTTEITVDPYVEPTKSSINTLNSLEVKGYELTPEFDPNVTDYNVTVPAGTDSVYIDITKKDGKSTANGDFKDVSLEPGANKCVITVTAENGSKKVYTVVVTVEEEDPIIVKIDDKEYTIVTNPKQLEAPKGYELSNNKYEDKDIPTLYNEKAKITLVGLKDSEGNIGLYVYDASEKTFELYEVIEVNGFTFIVMKPKEELGNYNNAKIINIAGKDYTVYYNDVDDIVLIYGMNVATGNVGWYRYDTEEQTFLRYREEKEEAQKDDKKKDHSLLLTFLFAGCFGISLIILLILLAMNSSKDKKNKKLVEILESQMPHKEDREPEVVLEGEDNLDKKFIELIDKEAEEKRNSVEEEDDEDAIALDEEFEKTKELSKREMKRLAKQLKKDEEEEARALREDFLSTRENEILGDTDILEEIPNSDKVLNNTKKKDKRKKK